MSIKQKLMITIILLVSVPMLISVVVGTWVAKDIAGELLVEQAEGKLVALRESRKQSLEEYINTSRKQLSTFANSDTVTGAADRFSDSYRDVLSEAVEDLDSSRAKLKDFYTNQFGSKYLQRNPGVELNVDQLMSGLNDNAIAMQALYISENPHPLGEKEQLESAPDSSSYSNWHENYHSQFKEFLETFGYYDIFIVHPETGDIMYSVYKELDYGTSLIDGPYADSDIGEAFRAANQATDNSFTHITSMSPYTPSYSDGAIFISTPIYSFSSKLGVLIFQLPLDRINAIMTGDGGWERDGLGTTGETYLVGQDKMVRSELREPIENFDKYLQHMLTLEFDQKTMDTIVARGSAVLQHKVDFSGVETALAGEKSGFGVHDDPLHGRVLSAFAKVDIPELDWIIMSVIDESEAFAPAFHLSETLLISSAAVAGILFIAAVLLGLWFTLRLTNPIRDLEQEIGEIETDSDLARRIQIHPGDVTSGISLSLNNMLEKMHGIVNMVSDSSQSMATATADMQVVSKLTSTDTQKQKEKTDQIILAMESMSETVANVAANADEAQNAVKVADTQSAQGNNVVMSTVDSITKLAEEIHKASEVIGVLSSEANNIGGVLDVIRGIAEQTNLLALNAAIEAARAGEQGRGFAVVADEVRTLASRTQESTEEIQHMIEGLQNGASNAVQVMEYGQKQAKISVEKANEASAALKEITATVVGITEVNESIAAASIDQRAVSDDVTRDIGSISEISDSTSTNAQKTEKASEELNGLAIKLQEAVTIFKL